MRSMRTKNMLPYRKDTISMYPEPPIKVISNDFGGIKIEQSDSMDGPFSDNMIDIPVEKWPALKDYVDNYLKEK